MNLQGWTKDDVKRFEELLIKANRLNLNQAKILIDGEMDKRDFVRIKKW